MTARSLPIRLAALLTATACGTVTSTIPASTPVMSTQAPPFSPSQPLSPDQRQWVDSTLASLSLHDRVGQMVMVWMLGDYSNTNDSSFAEVIRWVEQDRIGGVSMSLGAQVGRAAGRGRGEMSVVGGS